jgi:hypothetical protein
MRLEQTLQINPTIMPQEGPPSAGTPTCPGTHPVVAVVSEAILFPQFNHLGRPSHLHALEQTLDQINSIMPQERTSVLGDSTCPRDLHPVVAVVSEPILAQIPVQSF